MSHIPIILVVFVLGFPALTAAEITLERPVSDLTLVLNKPVSIQFPHGTTDQIKKKGEWNYRIKRHRVKNDTLPAGLTFDPNTRTLSGTPSEEHDATYAYHLQYVWGKKKAKMEKRVLRFRLVVKPPAVKITPERPLADLTMELNKEAAIQFPGGTTEQTQENGEWNYRIKRYRVENDNSLPAGLDFDRATRTLSGTPTEEHDVTYAYHLLYVWGKGKANRKRLVIPFRLVVKKPDPIAVRIRGFIGQASSVEGFVKGLPDLHKSHALYMVASQALDRDFVSEDHPRMISFGADARTIFAWGSDSDSDRYDTVEFIAAGERRWHFGVIDFAEDPPVVTRDPEECQVCHNNHPLWAKYPGWPGTLFERKQSTMGFVRSRSHDEALYNSFQGSSDPRISTVGHARLFPHSPILGVSRGAEFGLQLAIRHAELLAREVIAQPDDFYTVAEKFVCGGFLAVRAHWSRQVIDLKRMGEGLVWIDPSDRSSSYTIYWTGQTALEGIIMLLIINHLYETDAGIQAIYDRTSNTDSSRGPSYFHFAPGTATAADELRSRVELVRLVGQANLNKRRALRTGWYNAMILHAGHLHAMAPKVCQALRARDND